MPINDCAICGAKAVDWRRAATKTLPEETYCNTHVPEWRVTTYEPLTLAARERKDAALQQQGKETYARQMADAAKLPKPAKVEPEKVEPKLAKSAPKAKKVEKTRMVLRRKAARKGGRK